MQGLLLLLLGAQLSRVSAQPFSTPTTIELAPQTTGLAFPPMVADVDGTVQILEIRDKRELLGGIFARDTTTTSESTTSTTSTTSSTSTTSTTSSTSSTTSTTSSTTSTTSTTSSTTSSTTTSDSTTSTTSSATSSSTTASTTTSSTSSTTTSTATATSTVSAAQAKKNHQGVINAIIFVCVIFSLFAGVSIIHCAGERAKSKRIAARQLLKATAVVPAPLETMKNESSTNLLGDRSSVIFRDNPQSESRPMTARTPSPIHEMENRIGNH
ncbi:hypothetical protein N7454_003775 [Penicillium verhagenii]|nr:hypothetical protein N7454_003775 [Penicillium verhagenii]